MIKGLALVLALSYCSTINAGIIFSNEITGLAPENFNPFTDGQFVDAHVVVSGIGRGSGIAGTSGQDRYNARSWSTSSTIDLNDYFRFTIAPQAGFEMDYSDFIYTGQRSTSGPTTFSFRTSVDGFIAETPVASGATINLSSALFQNVTAPIEFRLYGYGTPLASGTFSINDFSFNGAVSQISAIPEPPSAALGVLAMTAGLWHSRLRRLPLSTTTSAGE